MNRTRSMAGTTTTAAAGVAACSVDNQLLPPMSSSSSRAATAGRNTSLHLRRSREATARKIIQRRLVAHQREQQLPRGMDDDCHDHDHNDGFVQESSKRNSTTTTTIGRPPVVLVYRQEHFDYPGPYVACAFLDADSVVAAADHFGAVDVVRLPPRSINDNNNNFGQPGNDDTNTFSNACTWNRSTSSRSSSTDGCKSSAASFSGRALQTGVQTYPKAPMSASFKIHPFQNGQAYAIGLASGEFRIFATETNQHIVSQWTCCSEKQSAGRVVKSSLCQTTNLKSTGAMDYFQHCWRHLGPQRRYKPHSSLSLLAQMRCCSSGAAVMATGALEEIFDWNRQDGHYFQGPSSPSSGVTGPLLPDCSALWDFRETASGGGLLALHAGVYKDCFALRILDNRQSQQQQRHAIGIDWNPLYQHNLLSAVSFLSDHVIATASSPKALGGPHMNGCAALGQPCIQLFDIRMIANPHHSSSRSSSQKSCILSNLPLAAYPREDAYGLTATKSLVASWETPVSVLAPCTKEKLLVTALEPDHARRHAAHAATTTGHFQFLKLSATSKGMLLATVRSSGGGKNGDAKKVEHLLLDPCVRHGQEATVTTVRQRCSSTWRPIFASNDQATLVCYSEGDKYHCSSAATSGNRAPAKKSHIAWHDNLQAKAYSSTTGTVPHNNLHSIGGGSGRRTLNGRIQQQQQDRKRAREQGTTIQSEHLGPIRLDTSQLRDRYWTESKLSCLALNDQATCCLGGSMDGDLYVWRAL